jgi:DNA-directed DNA polymerase III (polc)
MQANFTQFVHLQCHTEYSLVDGIVRINDLVAAAVAMQMRAAAITDQANLFGMVKFYQAAVAAGIKPIIGSDLYIENPEHPDKPTKAIFLCQNLQGYHNITQLISKSYLEGQAFGKPIVQRAWLQEFNSGLLVIANARDSDIAKALLAGNDIDAVNLTDYWSNLFKDRFYLGVTRTGRANEDEYNAAVIKLCHSKQCAIVALNEVCFQNVEDYEAHEARVCISEGVALDDSTRERKYSKQQYLRTQQEMQNLFVDLPEAIINATQIVLRCNLTLEFGIVHLPKFPVPDGTTPEQYLTIAAQQGLAKRFASGLAVKNQQHYTDRLHTELKVINDMCFASYFLIVADFIAWAFNNGVPVGPGRGSGAGSLVAYALNITNIDPLQYDLLFERFLNPERVSMPDFDIDFCMEGRDRVIEYVSNTYGRDSVSQIITYGTMAARAVIRDVGRVLGFPYGFVDQIAKLIPMEIGITLEQALRQEEVLSTRYQQEDEVKNLIDLAKKLEGITRNVGKHAGGVVIAPSKLTNFTPLYCEAGELQVITQFDKNDVETIGLVKFDFLGLRTLTVINWAVQSIDQNLDISTIPLNDVKTFKLLCDVNTTAVFQLESRGMKDLIRRLHPDNFEDIIALVALFRPGPLQSGMVDDFINRKLGRAVIEYPHPDVEPILKPTYGVILYQEQVMQIAQVLAGYTLGAADILRKAMGKKKPEEMALQRVIFTDGAVARGVDKRVATYIFDLMEKFAGYGFNKSHSAAYALVSYQTAWLKAHYPSQFMASVLSADMAHTDKIVLMIEDCCSHGIKIVSPNVNYSEYKFIVDQQNRIVYGLGAVKGVGEGAIETIINARNTHGAFKDLFDLCVKLDNRKVTRRVLEALINAGALDVFGMHRAALMGNLDGALKAAEQTHKNASLGQIDLFGDTIDSNDIGILLPSDAFAKWSEQVRLNGEKISLGLYLTGHPITQYEAELANITTHKIINLRPGARGEKQIIAGILMAVRTMQTKRGDRMAFITLEDRSGRQEVAIFADLFNEVRDLLKKDNLLIVQGETKKDDYSGGFRVRALQIYDLTAARNKFAKKIRIGVDATQGLAQDFVLKLKNVLQPYKPGACKIELNYKSSGANAVLQFGADWGVTPAAQLLADVENLAIGQVSAQVCYEE